ncbi:MAG: hypothetical protein WA917_08370 [Comamonas sp.]|nr:hypothetical protein [Comamonas sp.]
MKYAALILNVVAIALLGWALYAVTQLTQARASNRPLPALEMSALPEALRSDKLRVNETFDAIERIQTRAPVQVATAQSLIALPPPGQPLEGSVRMPERSLSLHLDDLAAQTQSVVIDGRLLRQGARLEGGGKVVRVEPNEVLVAERLGRQKLTLPTDQLRVGTLRWSDGSLASTSTQVFKAGVPGAPPGPIKVLP